MERNKYKHRTPKLGIPVIGYNEPLWPELELKKWTMVENLLLSAIRGTNNCIFHEGHVALDKQEDGTFSVRVSKSSSGHSISGIVAGQYFDGPKVVMWKDLEVGNQYFLYVTATEKTAIDPSSIRPVSLKHRVPSRSRLLVASVDLRKDNPVVEFHPEGKTYSASMEAQSTMLSPRVVDFDTEGMTGIVLSAPRRVVFAEVSRVHSDDSSSMELGEVMFGYYGDDPMATRPGDVVVYNNGDSGVPAKAIIFTE